MFIQHTLSASNYLYKHRTKASQRRLASFSSSVSSKPRPTYPTCGVSHALGIRAMSSPSPSPSVRRQIRQIDPLGRTPSFSLTCLVIGACRCASGHARPIVTSMTPIDALRLHPAVAGPPSACHIGASCPAISSVQHLGRCFEQVIHTPSSRESPGVQSFPVLSHVDPGIQTFDGDESVLRYPSIREEALLVGHILPRRLVPHQGSLYACFRGQLGSRHII
ncbi:hypothetical protein BD413DRAFT_509178, partial [Trametes elegans]